jgi:hypothetical protein
MNVFITIWNRFSWAIPLCEDFEKAGVNVVLIDNGSTYEPCVKWLKGCRYKVHFMDHNVGPWAFFITDLYKEYKDRYFMISDSDQDISKVPKDFPEYLIKGLELHDYDQIWKCGLSQEINDIPHGENHVLKEIYNYEKGFWLNKTEHGFYKVAMDLGIAVYDRNRRTEQPTNTDQNGHGWYNAIRADRPYTSRHLDWYLNKDKLRPEDIFYFEGAYAHFGWGHKFYNEIVKCK